MGVITQPLVYKGTCSFANLPKTGQRIGDVWVLSDNFPNSDKAYWNGSGWEKIVEPDIKMGDLIDMDNLKLVEYNPGDLIEINLFTPDNRVVDKMVNFYEPPKTRKGLPYLATVVEYDYEKFITEKVGGSDRYADFTSLPIEELNDKKLLLVIPFDLNFTRRIFSKDQILLTPDQVSPCYFQRDLLVSPNNRFDIEYLITKIEPKFMGIKGRFFNENDAGIWFHLKDTDPDNPTRGQKIEYLDLVKDYDIVWE